MDPSTKSKIDTACSTAEEFTKLYYDSADKRRHSMSPLYQENAILTWNGNGVLGNDKIQKFLIELPPTVHNLATVDSQPILDSVVAGQLTFMIQVSGTVKFPEKLPKSFQQSFLITALGNKWKIVSDCFRLQEPLGGIKE